MENHFQINATTQMTPAQAKTACLAARREAFLVPENVTIDFSVYGSGADFTNLKAAVEAMEFWTIPNNTKIRLNVPKGRFRDTACGVVASDLRNVSVVGVTPTTVNITAVELMLPNGICKYEWDTPHTKLVNGVLTPDYSKESWKYPTTFKYYKLIYTLNTVAGISEGDFLMIRNGGSQTEPDVFLHYGGWEIINVDAGTKQVTAVNFCHELEPFTGQFTSPVPAKVIHSSVVYDPSSVLTQGVNGIEILHGCHLGSIDNLAMVGRCWPEDSDPRGGNRGKYEYQEPVNYYGLLIRQNASVTVGSNAVITGFCGDNVHNYGLLTFNGATSNSWGHNIVTIGEGAQVTFNAGISSGGFLDGVCTQDGGLTAGSLIVCGNARSGLTQSGSSGSNAVNITAAVGNGYRYGTSACTSGAISILSNGRLCCGSMFVARNKGYGIRAIRNGNLSASAAVIVRNNENYGVQALNSSTLFFNNLRAENNGTRDLDASTASSIDVNTLQNAATVVTSPAKNTMSATTKFALIRLP